MSIRINELLDVNEIRVRRILSRLSDNDIDVELQDKITLLLSCETDSFHVYTVNEVISELKEQENIEINYLILNFTDNYRELDDISELTVEYLEIPSSQLNRIGKLPESLIYLCLDDNNLNEIPSLPKKLAYLNVSDNRLTTLPPLPSSLEVLNIDNNNIRTLPTLPKKIKRFSYRYDKLKQGSEFYNVEF